jgi:DNA translocase FtsK/SpoIIIE-like protein
MKTDFATVRSRVGGIKGVMQKLGDAPDADHKWKNMSSCPFCTHKDCAGIYTRGGVDYFRCHKPGCSSGCMSLTEVGYIATRKNLSDKKPAEGGASPAYKFLLQLAGCWEEPEEKAASQKVETPPPTVEKLPEEKPLLPNPVLPSPSTELFAVEQSSSDGEMITNCIEVIRLEKKASASLLMRRMKIGFSRAERILAELEKRGIIGPSKGNDPASRVILKLPDQPPGLITVKIGDDVSVVDTNKPASAIASPAVEIKPEEKPKLTLGLAALRWFYGKLTPTHHQMSHYLESGEPVPQLIPAALAKKLRFKLVSLFKKRGLPPEICEALGFRANPTSNEALLQELQEHFSWEELRASGLWMEAEGKRKLGRRPNLQFAGKGQIGRKPENERRGKDDKFVWGFNEPVLIPYFDEAGELIKLRPHKGGGLANTVAGRPRLYIPRDYRTCADWVEKFHTVIITEGEYKADAIWSIQGLGAKLQIDANDGLPILNPEQMARFEPIGVCALPGISYVRHVEMRMELDRWLKEVGARKVIVGFDDEDNSSKPMHKRFDALIAARVLAIQLSTTLHVDARVCILPKEWRNEHGKADWDGALVNDNCK